MKSVLRLKVLYPCCHCLMATSDSNINKIKKLVFENRHESYEELKRWRYLLSPLWLIFWVWDSSPHDWFRKSKFRPIVVQEFFGQKHNECHRPSTILTWYAAVWHFHVPKAKITTSRKTFWVNWGHKRKFTEGVPICPRKMYGGLGPALA